MSFVVTAATAPRRRQRWWPLAALLFITCAPRVEPERPRHEQGPLAAPPEQWQAAPPPAPPPEARPATTTAPAALLDPAAPAPERNSWTETSRIPAERAQRIDRLVHWALEQGKAPGCVVVLGRSDGPFFVRAYGNLAVQPEAVAMRRDTVFDLASLTKPVATATAIMILVERGFLRLDHRVSRYLPRFRRHGKERVTVRHLLTHQGGLPPANLLSLYEDGRQQAINHILETRPVAPAGSQFIYSDLGYIVLGELVSRVTGQSLAAFAEENIFEPLAMNETTYLPPEALRRRAAPTTQRGDEWIQGVVQDPRAWRLGGVAGNAGLFSTAADLSRFARMMLNHGELEGQRVMSRATVSLMTTSQVLPQGVIRTLGWDRNSRYSTQRAPNFSPHAYGHGGYTGTSLWIDPERDLFVLFLSNRVHPLGQGSINGLARLIGGEAVAARRETNHGERYNVMTGIDVLRRDGFHQLQGRRVGLITNQSGRARDGQSTRSLLAQAPGVELTVLFSPEHGLDGDREGHIGSGRDEETGLPVYSLFGAHRSPPVESLENIDTLVFDIQDVGVRFYTYMSTMRAAMQTVAGRDIRFVVLDRPNPLGGHRVEGPLLDPGQRSFVNHHRLPVLHGMTAGELARLFRGELDLDVDLTVIPMEGWQRSQWWDETGLQWVRPSPNLRTPEQVILYPALGLLEGTNVSVGRGTETPFEVLGAPWINGGQLTRTARRARLPGVTFTPTSFIPSSSRHRGRRCQGVQLRVTNREAFQPVRTGLALARALGELHQDQWNSARLYPLVGHLATITALRSGEDLETIEESWNRDLAEFHRRRAQYLLYRDGSTD